MPRRAEASRPAPTLQGSRLEAIPHPRARILVPAVLATLALGVAAAAAPAGADPVDVDPTGEAQGDRAAVSLTGDATCQRYRCVAVSGTGTASGGLLAASGTGDAATCNQYEDCLAASGTGRARAGIAASGTDEARGVIAVSGTGPSNGTVGASASNECRTGPCADAALLGDAEAHMLAASAAGDADGYMAASAGGDARGPVAVDADTAGNAADAATTRHDGSGSAPHGWPDKDEAAVRPGVRIAGEVCTANAVFSDPADTTYYVATAAHCVDERPLGSPIQIAGGEASGVLAYDAWEVLETVEADEVACGDRAQQDLALVEVDDDHEDEVHPATLHFGGPTTLRDRSASGEELYTYGNSSYRGDHHWSKPTVGVSVGNGECRTEAILPMRGYGDSGSPVLGADGAALGIYVTAPGGYVNLAQAVDFAEAHTGLELELETWPRFSEDFVRVPG